MYFVEYNGVRFGDNKAIVAFFALCLPYFFLSVTSEYLLISDDLFYDFLGQQLAYERINEIINEGKKWKWITYALLPLLILFKIFFTSVCLSAGGFVLGIQHQFKRFFEIAIYAEFVFLLPSIAKLLWFALVYTNYTFEDLQYFSPLSVFSLFNPKEIEPWFAYPLQLLNFFELLYWFILAYQLKEEIGKSFAGSLGFVASTYGVGLLIWVVLVMFLTVSIS